ncbi:MAG: hypothetical protein DYH20_01650 [Gammaproteobacteria bacterium PRO9]|nr:hypothetical protein [Gammaproteobacteria bacterium PRO9]
MSINRSVKGQRPVFATGDADASVNRLLAMVSALAAEVAVLRDRQRTLELLLERQGIASPAAVEGFEVEGDDLAERMRWQAEFLRRVYYILEREADERAGSGP